MPDSYETPQADPQCALNNSEGYGQFCSFSTHRLNLLLLVIRSE
jgi:hypothetical protein